MKTKIIVISFLLSSISCASQPREITSKSNIKLEVRNQNIRDYIEIDGYYQGTNANNRDGGRIFFEDGTSGSFGFKDGVTEEMKRENLSQAIYSWEQKGQVRWGHYWGVFKIDKDTIVLQTFNRAGIFSMPWSLYEEKYEIIDKQTLKIIYQRPLYPTDKNELKKDPYEIGKRNIIDKFIPADSLPSSDCWLKEEKWIWRNEQDWKDYMEKIKERKKK